MNLKITASMLILCSMCMEFSYAQGTPKDQFSSMCLEWRNFSWLDKEYYYPNITVNQRDSDYDWWYDHCTAYINPVTKTGPNGYIACGISKYRADRNLSNPPIAYDERPFGGCAYGNAPFRKPNCEDYHYDYGNLENCESGKLGLGFNTIGMVNENGVLQYLIPMNYEGEYVRVKQLKDGNFMTVGHSRSTRKRLQPPQNGMPLMYNPSLSAPGNYFKYNVIFDSQNKTHVNASHWDVMKFDFTGTCLYNSIYGQYNFNSSPVNTWGALQGLTETQLCYLSGGTACDFVQKMTGTSKWDSRITIVGQQQRSTPVGPVYKAAIVQIEDNGNVVSKRFLDTSPTDFESVARAITLVDGPIPYFLIAVTKQVKIGANEKTILELYALEYGFGPSSPLVKVYEHGSAYAVNDRKAGSTAWSLHYKNGHAYLPVIEKCNNVWWSGDNFGELTVYKVSVPTSMPSVPPPTTVLSKKITNVRAFDLKARMTDLMSGNFAIVSSVRTKPWNFGTIPPYILGCTPVSTLNCANDPSKPDPTTSIGYWNTDAYVAEILASNLGIVWSMIFNSENAPPSVSNSGDFRSSINGGGDPKHQECVYAISEGPNQSIIVSGNSSGNVDDNYMVKLGKCSISPDNH